MSLLARVAWVRAVTDLFRDYDRPFVRGDFTAVRRSSVEEALEVGQLPVWVDASGTPVVAMMWRGARKAEPVCDSFDRVIGHALAGDLRISRIACAPGREDALADVLDALRAMLGQEAPVTDDPRVREPVFTINPPTLKRADR